MDNIKKAKFISIWIFVVPFLAINACLILITQFHELFPDPASVIHWTFPYIDGGASISRTARPYPSWLIFKPAMFFTSYLLIKYWIYNRSIIKFFNSEHKYIKRIFNFGVASAIFLTLHSFIIFELIAQAYLVATFYSFREKLLPYINPNILKVKLILVSVLIIVATISIPIISLPGNDFLGFNLKFFKHALEWDYFLGIISFYLLTFFMWKNKLK